MNFQPAYRIFLTDPLGYTDRPLIVTTVYTSARGHPRAEWFLLVPEGKGLLLCQRNKLDQPAFPVEQVQFDEELLLTEACDQAVLRLRRHVQDNKNSFAPLLLAKPTETADTDLDYLSKLWMRGSYCGCLSEMRAKSECPPLIDTLTWIHRLPMLTSNDL